LLQGFSGANPFSTDTQAATVNTTGGLTVDVTASIADLTQAENVTCDQLTILLN